jgi:small neutral amino acid transporter SnatA (MarC family)
MFLASGYLRRHLSPTALAALNRGMGIIVAAIAIEFIFAGVQGAFVFGSR